MQTVNDQLSSRNWFFSSNPWWLLGWLFLFGVALSLLVFLTMGSVWLVRQLRKDRPVASD
jgi:hypothetical protein